MIERGLLTVDTDQKRETSQPPSMPPLSSLTSLDVPGADTASPHGTESKLNKLLQTPTINKINYMDNYKLLCPGSTSITSSALKLPNQKSVIQKGPSSVRRPTPTATITSVQQAPMDQGIEDSHGQTRSGATEQRF